MFDTWYTTDPTAQVKLLGVACLICMIILSFLFAATGSLTAMAGFEFVAEMMWMSWGQLSGTGGSPDGGLWGTRLVGIAVAFMGMFVFSLVCAFIEEAINAKLEDLRKGKSRVLESGFSLIIGWSDRLLPLLIQLTQANESSGGLPIVVLADRDKEWMDEYLRDNITDMLGSTIITRQGTPFDLSALRKVNCKEARSIVVLSEHSDPDESDAQTARTVLALTGHTPGNRLSMGVPGQGGISGHVVCEVCDIDNQEMMLLGMDAHMAPDWVKTVVANNLTGRLMILCSLEPGLARVFTHILAFEFNEFYFKPWPELTGRKFCDVCFMFDDAVPFGIHLAEPDQHGKKIIINPTGDQVIGPEDEIIVIAEDDDSYHPGELKMVDPGPNPAIEEAEDGPKALMLIGFRRDLDDLVTEVDKWVKPGSTLMLFCDMAVEDRMQILQANGLRLDEIVNIDTDPPTDQAPGLHHMVGNPMLLRNLEHVEPQNYDGVIVLTEKKEGQDGLAADSCTMVTTLLIRDIQRRAGVQPVLVSEILDPRTSTLVRLAKMNDFICANDFVSMALGQIAEESDIHGLIEEIFSPEGSEMHIKPISLYAAEGEMLNFWELVTRARNRAEVCLGWIKEVEYEGGAPVPHLNPQDKKQKHYWGGRDQLVVLSED